MLNQGQLGATAGSIYTVGAATTVQVKTLVFFNSDTVTNIVSVFLVPNNATALGTAGLTNQVLSVSLTAGNTFEFSPAYPVGFSAQNDSIQASATNANKVNFFVMGVAN